MLTPERRLVSRSVLAREARRLELCGLKLALERVQRGRAICLCLVEAARVLATSSLELARELKLNASCSLELATNSLEGVRRGARMLLLSVEQRLRSLALGLEERRRERLLLLKQCRGKGRLLLPTSRGSLLSDLVRSDARRFVGGLPLLLMHALQLPPLRRCLSRCLD